MTSELATHTWWTESFSKVSSSLTRETKNNFNVILGLLADNAGQELTETESILLEDAYKISIRAHANQFRRSGKLYILHVEGVVKNLLDLCIHSNTQFTVQDVIVAFLHDVLEDHPEYFDEVYSTFWYDIVYRIICLSKPEKRLFEKWNNVIPKEKITEVKHSNLYQFWNAAIYSSESITNNNLDDTNFSKNADFLKNFLINSTHPIPHINSTEDPELVQLLQQAKNEFTDSIQSIKRDINLTPEEKENKYQKRWIEYASSLQLFLLSPENLRIKFSDKIHNLEDTEYRTQPINIDDSDKRQREQESRARKTTSILRTLDIYRFLASIHGLPSAFSDRLKLAKVKSDTVLGTNRIVK